MINKINLRNFYNFNNLTLNFSKINIITGRNGSGKTTITSELFSYILFGKSVKRNNIEDMITKGQKSGFVEIEIDNKLTIRRYLNDNKYRNKLIIVEDKENIFNIKNMYKTKDIEKMIIDYLGIDYNEFVNIYLRYPEIKTFTQNKDISFINNMLGIDKLFKFIDDVSRIYNFIDKQKKEYNLYLEKYTNNIEEFNKKIEDLLKNKTDLNESLINDLKREINDLENEKRKMKEVLLKINDKFNKYVEVIDKLRKEKDEYDKQKQEYINILTEKKTIINNYTNELNKIKKVKKYEKCPFCLSKVDIKILEDKEKEIISEIKNISNEVNKINEKISEIDKKISEYISKIEKLEIEKKQKEREFTNKIKVSLDKLDKILKDKYDKLMHFEKSKNVNQIIDNIKTNIDILNKQIFEIEDKLNKINRDYIISTFLKNIFNKKSKYIKMYYDLNISTYKQLTKEILNYFLDNTIEDIEINVDKDSFIFINGIPYTSLSSAQKKIVDLSFIFSYIILYTKNKKFIFFVLDEFFDNNLDADNSKKLLSYLLKLYNMISKKGIDIQLFITTNNIEFFEEYIRENNINNQDFIKIIKL